MSIKTIRVASADTEQGYVIINVADFDPSVHTPMEGETPPTDVERAQLARQRDDGMTTRYGVGRATHEPVIDPTTARPIPPAA